MNASVTLASKQRDNSWTK